MRRSLRRFSKVFEFWYWFNLRRITIKLNHNNWRELCWTLIPTLALVIIAIPSVRLLYYVDSTSSLGDFVYTYKVIGHQWFWSYEYLSLDNFQQMEFDSYMLDEAETFGIHGLRLLEVDNPLIVPVNTKLRFLITAADVLHSWSVPSLGVKVDAVPGRISQVCLTIKRIGEFYGQCSEICGINHGFMPIKIVAMEATKLKSCWFESLATV